MKKNITLSKQGQTNESLFDIIRPVLSRWLYIDDWEVVEIILGAAAALYAPGDPLWLRIIKPSGGGGSELLRPIATHPDSLSLDNLTTHTFTTGYKLGTDLLPMLNGKRVITSDLSTLLGKRKEDKAEIFSQFRRAYDGEYSAFYGSDKPQTGRLEASFDWLCAVTPAIEQQRIAQGELGERFIDIRWSPEREGLVQKAVLMAGKEEKMREQLGKGVSIVLDGCKKLADNGALPDFDMEFRLRVAGLAEKTALLRTPVARDRFKNVLYMPDPERGTRLAKAMLKLAGGLSLLTSDDEPYGYLVRVAADCIPSVRARALYGLLRGASSISELEKATNLPQSTLAYYIEDLELLGVLRREGQWKLDFLGDIEVILAKADYWYGWDDKKFLKVGNQEIPR